MIHMPFGKYRGQALSSVPDDYLRWCLDDCEFVASKPSLKAALGQEWQRRMRPPPRPPRSPSPSRDADATILPLVREFVRAGHRALLQKHHPDHGGDHAAMVQLNANADALRRKGWL
jgi:hypothetical protein